MHSGNSVFRTGGPAAKIIIAQSAGVLNVMVCVDVDYWTFFFLVILYCVYKTDHSEGEILKVCSCRKFIRKTHHLDL